MRRTWLRCSKRSLPRTGRPEFERVFSEEYPKCENISIDYAVLERRSAKGELKSEIYCLPADFGWNDLGSWASLHEHLGEAEADNVIDGATTGLVTIPVDRQLCLCSGQDGSAAGCR